MTSIYLTTSTSTVEDMTTLFNLTEESLLENLENRYKAKLIYTYTGSILVSVNPYEILPLYLPAVVREYFSKQRGALPPHIFAIADAAYTSMFEEHKNQSIIISGESGAGKTEATKLIIQYLAARTNKHSEIEQMIVESSPILEAFGNAKTVRNNNSSRFGKYIEIHFNKSGFICGAKIIQYLLEKSRITFQAQSERNYHIFYQLLAGASAELKEQLSLKEPKEYHYLNQSGCITIENVRDADDFNEMQSAMTFLGLGDEMKGVIFVMLAAVLHLGNIQFEASDATKGAEGSVVKSTETLNIAANLLQLDAAALANALTFRHVLIRGQKFVIPLKTDEATDARDALAKSLYDKVFQWLVTFINSRISKNEVANFIGVLDIFGFENFKVNSFEQFCINYCNEKLQQHFNQHIFKLEQEEYNREKINWSKINFNDNQDCLDLIEKRPLGVLSLLDEECKFPKATDLTLLEKLHTNHEKHPNYEKPRLTKTNFIMKHYAGDVSYESKGFLDKNKDTLQDDLLSLVQGSKIQFLRDLFAFPEEEADESKKGGTKKALALTVGAQFKGQLASLMSTLSATCPHFVRCVKPNTVKQPNTFDRDMVLAQLRYAGMMETIRIRRLGYPVRYTHKEFVDRFGVLNDRKFIIANLAASNGASGFTVTPPADPKDPSSVCEAVIKNLNNCTGIVADDWLLGLTKIFLRDTQFRIVEELRIKLMSAQAIRIQSVWRMYRLSKKYQKIKKAAVTFQALIKAYRARVEYQLRKRSSIIIQAFARMIKARKEYRRIRDLFRGVPTIIRGWLARKRFAKEVAEVKERKRRLEEIKLREAGEAERAKLEQEEKERQQQEIAQRMEEDKKRQAEEKKRQEDEVKKKQAVEEKKKAEEKKQELQELNQLEDITSLQDMLKAQEANHLSELNDIVGNMESFSFESSSATYAYDPKKYTVTTDALENLSLGELLLGLKKTVQAALGSELDDAKFKIPAELELATKKVAAPPTTRKAAALITPKPQAPEPTVPAAPPAAGPPAPPKAIAPATPTAPHAPLPANPPAAPAPASLPSVPPAPSDLPPPPTLPPPPGIDGGLPPPPLPGLPPPPPPGIDGALPPPPPLGDDGIPPPIFDLPPPPSFGGLPPAPSFGGLPPAPSFGGLPPAPSFGGLPPTLSGDLPPPPPPGGLPPTLSFGELPPAISDQMLGLPPPPPIGSIPPPEELHVAVSSTAAPSRLVEDEEISLYAFKDFAAKNFREQKKQKKKGDELDYVYSKGAVKASLLNFEAEHNKLAVEISNKMYVYATSKKLGSADWAPPAQFILQKGLVVEELRDEIYAQLIKQTTENPNRDQTVKYWELIVFCSATFLPSNKLSKYFGSHIQHIVQTDKGSLGQLAQLAVKNQVRLKKNGPRKLVPSISELEALKDAKPFVIKVHLTDGSVKSLIIDSATTVLEASNSLSTKLLLRPDSTVNGFSIVELFNSIERDLNKEDKVADSLAKFENLEVAMREQKMSVNAKLLFKKRLFMESEITNKMEREYVFHQTVADILSGALPCSVEDIVAFGALKLQVDCGDYTAENARTEAAVITKYLPARLVKLHTEELFKQWEDLKTVPREDAKAAHYNTATQLPLFSHSVFEVTHESPVAGLPSNLYLAINSSGVHFVEKSTQAFLRSIPFSQLGPAKYTAKVLTLTWDQPQKSLDVNTTEGSRITGLIRDYLTALRTNAKFARALKDYQVSSEHMLSFHRGEVISIISRDEANQWYVGELEGRSGTFPVDHVELLPGDSPPAGAVARPASVARASGTAGNRLSMTLRGGAVPQLDDGSGSPAPARALPSTPSTLEGASSSGSLALPPRPGEAPRTAEGVLAFARVHFRKPTAAKGKRPPDVNQLLSFTKDPIKDSLIELDSKVSKKAVTNFLHVMAYMDDYPAPGKMAPPQLAQTVVQLGIDSPELRDEILCQIWKQISGNPRTESTKKGSELLLFCVNSFPPSTEFASALQEGLESRASTSQAFKFAEEKLKHTLNLPRGTHRKLAPSTKEIESLAALEENMMCKIIMPNRTTRAILANSYTTARDAYSDASVKINLTHNVKHFGLYEFDEDHDIVHVVPDGTYVCDLLALWEQTKSSNKFTIRRKYFFEDPDKLLEQESLWTSDPVGFDLTFSQIQEDVLAGKYPITEKDAPYIAALLVQIRHPNSSKAPITKDSLNLFIPKPLHNAKSVKNWISAIELHLFEVVGQTPDYTKLLFLKAAAKYAIFGSVTFPAIHKETNQRVILGISRRGVSIYDVNAKEPKSSWSFSAISSWTLVGDCLVLMSGNLMKPVKSTFQADDLGTIQTVYSAYSDLAPTR